MTHVKGFEHLMSSGGEGVYYATGVDVFLHFIGGLVISMGAALLLLYIIHRFVSHFRKVDRMERQLNEMQCEDND